MNAPRGQRGIALLTAIILVSLATILAVSIAFATAMTARRGAASFTVEQGLQLGAGAEALAAYVLAEDARRGARQGGGGQSQQDFPGEEWTNPYPPVEIAADVALEAQLLDESGKFNLNTLVDGTGAVDDEAMEIFQRLLELLKLDPKLGPLLADWIDPDTAGTPGGGEDELYTVTTPGFRTANSWIASPSELMALPGLTREQYLLLLPHVTALPPDARAINLCFASAELLDAIESVFEQRLYEQYSADPKGLLQSRENGCFPTASLVGQNSSLPADRQNALKAKLAEQSTYFRLQTWVSIGTTRFALYSLLQRQNQQVSLVYRTFGTE